ncbi:xaa-Pro aminopeptidase 3-like [Contarinia nasturtii]|uniref:xaa-Pro aminopeptidase 3-like n=1 Tax=Contarinia nasturtii TaxID=265458 RepID=UPI0012D4440A|nr:xaa-Pro aminopeptidase 3-like [Contarinia nasturtii]
MLLTRLVKTTLSNRLFSNVRLSIGHQKCISLRNFSSSISRSEKLYTEHLESLHRDGVRFGQPTQFSHPHLINANELAIGLLPSEFSKRRHKLMEKIKEHCIKHNKPSRNIVIVPATTKKYMTGEIPYFFRQNTDFFYLTGCLEPDSVLVLWTNDEGHSKSALFMRPKNKHDELWDGPRTGVDHSVNFFGVDEAYSLGNLVKFVEQYVSQTTPSVNVWYENNDQVQPKLYANLRPALSTTTLFQSPIEFLHELRLIKSPAETELMRKTCQIGSKAINLTMKESKPGDSEHHIQTRVDFHCRMNNAQFLAYPPVVAGGNNANVIHYINNTQVVNDGELVLMDAGCEYGAYSSDITRTWPINGKFTPAQEVLYEIVYAVQTELLTALSTVEKITLDELFNLMCYRLGIYLQEVGLIDKSLNQLEAARDAFKYCPHHVSHYVGMDIHDTAFIKRDRILQPGMVFAVEPGVYFPADCQDIPQEFRGIGIRIEDDVLYTDNGVEILTKDCIKEINELKKLLSN